MRHLIIFLKRQFLFLCCGIFILGLASCETQKLQKALERFIQKEVIIPQGILQMTQGIDTIMLNPTAGDARLVVYVDSLDCSPCRLGHMYDYEEIIEYHDEIGAEFVPVFIFSPPRAKVKEVMLSLKMTDFNYPVFIDTNHIFGSSNTHIPEDKRFHTFLLDKNGQVILVGDPVNNPSLWKLYKQTISQLIENGGTMPE